MTRKKNKFLTFCCSLLPGAAHMYMGFMKMGVSLMGSFFFLCFIAAFFNLDAFLLALPIIWFYAFFDAINKNSTDDEEFYQLEDNYLFHINQFEQLEAFWNKQSNSLIAVLLILSGIYLLLNPIVDWVLDYVTLTPFQSELLWSIYHKAPQFILAIVIIVIGIRLIKGKKKEFERVEREDDFDGRTY